MEGHFNRFKLRFSLMSHLTGKKSIGERDYFDNLTCLQANRAGETTFLICEYPGTGELELSTCVPTIVANDS